MARNSEQQIRCSFCGKRENQTSKMIAGPGVYICSDCVQACSDLLAPVWQDVGTYSIVDGAAEVVDTNWLSVAARIYRFVKP